MNSQQVRFLYVAVWVAQLLEHSPIACEVQLPLRSCIFFSFLLQFGGPWKWWTSIADHIKSIQGNLSKIFHHLGPSIEYLTRAWEVPCSIPWPYLHFLLIAVACITNDTILFTVIDNYIFYIMIAILRKEFHHNGKNI